MTRLADVRKFFAENGTSAVADAPFEVPPETGDEEALADVDLAVECPEADWRAVAVGEEPTRPGETPTRFIDGSQVNTPLLCLRTRQGVPVPVLLAEVGAVCLRADGRTLSREFRHVERVITFVADYFDWEQVEAFSQAIHATPELGLRFVRANPPDPEYHSPYDYDAMRSQARAMCGSRMRTLERIAVARAKGHPALVDGPLWSTTAEPSADGPPVLGVVGRLVMEHLHPVGFGVTLGLRAEQRSPVYRILGRTGDRYGHFSIATWYVRLASPARTPPNAGLVRVEMSWKQFESSPDPFALVSRVSRTLIDYRLRGHGGGRLPAALEPLARAEESLRPLFTPMDVLAGRIYRQVCAPGGIAS